MSTEAQTIASEEQQQVKPEMESPVFTPQDTIKAMFPKDDYSEVSKQLEKATGAEAGKTQDGGKAPDAVTQAEPTGSEKAEPVKPVEEPTKIVEEDDDSDLPDALRPSKKPVVTSEAGAEMLKTEFGIEPNDYGTIASKLKEADEAKRNYEAVVADIQKLDPVVQAMLNANLNGEDPHKAYEMAMGKRVDFTKPVDKQNMETLISAYASDIMTLEEYRESKELGTDEKEVRAAEKLALAKFESDQEKFKLQQANYENQKNAKKDTYTKSVELAISTASSSVPNPDTKEFKDVVGKIKSTGLVPLFYNQDGTLRSDAVEKAFYAENGKAFIDDLVKRNQKLMKDLKAKSEELAKSVGALPEKTPEIPGGNAKGGNASEIPEFAKAIVAAAKN